MYGDADLAHTLPRGSSLSPVDQRTLSSTVAICHEIHPALGRIRSPSALIETRLRSQHTPYQGRNAGVEAPGEAGSFSSRHPR